ncbi:MAG: xanthine dehydrogenase accessory protein XdhC [Candidatus Eisenbacteria bacterium]|nr:xanthine dehydrogenase accessory protein XdhC [Candidatus Eisenbacteria bacterium]
MDRIWNLLPRLEAPAVLATVVRVTGSAPRGPGSRMLVFAVGRIEGSLGGGRLELKVCAEARTLLAEGTPHVHRTYRLNPAEDQCCGGEVEVFMERIAPRPHVVMFGAGHVGQAVARALAPLPFRVTVIDDREEYAAPGRFPGGVEVICADPLTALGSLHTTAEASYALVFTHSHKLDIHIVSVLVARPLRYLGMIGSRTKWSRFRAALLERGVQEADLARITSPIGIGVGGKEPEEIAVSVVAQLLAVRDGLRVEVASLAGMPRPEEAGDLTHPRGA